MSPPLIRRTGLMDRKVQHRDARLILVATEDRYAGPQYFDILQRNAVIDRSRVKVHVLATGEDNRSSPHHVLQRLDDFQVGLEPMDERWLSLDVDRWGEKGLSQVCAEATKKGYRLAVSNPCFEAWLLLHFVDRIDATTAEACVRALRAVAGSYNKTRLQSERYTTPTVRAATSRARALDMNPLDRWPQATGSHVYRLMEGLLPPEA
ncbi:MAG: RloB domain-containing protein [Alphaproteobacteria bacterium]|nr:RloB domain-containing protein [Alphaproteobacteria bacterium]